MHNKNRLWGKHTYLHTPRSSNSENTWKGSVTACVF